MLHNGWIYYPPTQQQWETKVFIGIPYKNRLVISVVTGILGWGVDPTQRSINSGCRVVFFIGVQNMWDGQRDPQLLGEILQDQEIES